MLKLIKTLKNKIRKIQTVQKCLRAKLSARAKIFPCAKVTFRAF